MAKTLQDIAKIPDLYLSEGGRLKLWRHFELEIEESPVKAEHHARTEKRHDKISILGPSGPAWLRIIMAVVSLTHLCKGDVCKDAPLRDLTRIFKRE